MTPIRVLNSVFRYESVRRILIVLFSTVQLNRAGMRIWMFPCLLLNVNCTPSSIRNQVNCIRSGTVMVYKSNNFLGAFPTTKSVHFVLSSLFATLACTGPGHEIIFVFLGEKLWDLVKLVRCILVDFNTIFRFLKAMNN